MKRLNDHLSLRFRVFVMTLMGVFMLCITDAYAGTAYTDGRAYLRAGSPNNAGKVYVSTSNATPAASAYKPCNAVQTSESTTPSASAQVSGGQTTTTYHFWAVANAGYKFTGWYNSNGVLQGDGAAHISASVTSGTAGSSDTHAYLDMHAAFIKIIQMGFVRPENGTFDITHAGEAVSNYASITVDGKVLLTAHPADGYKLRGWYTTTNGGVTKNYFAFGSTCEPNFTNNVTIGAEFVPDDGKATFWIKGTNQIFDDLNAANNAASSGNIIVVVSDGMVGAGTYTIQSGVTLLIPYNETYNLMTTPKVVHYTSAGAAPTLSAFRRLTLAEGAIINCSGNICIGGQQTAVNGGNPTSLPCGAAGVLDMSRGGTVNLQSGSSLYAWGFVKGQDMDQGNNTDASGVGVIHAAAGATVWEDFQCGEWRGGTASSTIYNNKGTWRFFPFQSYSIQNVEVPVNYATGSNLKCHWAIFGNGSTSTVTFPLVASSNSLFKLATGGTLRKWYDPTTDRVCYELGGNTSLDALNLNVLGQSVSSSDYNLPIPANMQIILKSGTNLTISKPMTMHAGSVVEIKKDATLKLNSNVYLYDKDDWDTYCMYAYYFRTYKNLTSHYNRGTGTSKELLEDARVIVDGTLDLTGSGRLYATAHGADVMGNGGGILKYGTLPGNTTMTQCKNLCDAVSVNIRSVNMHNDNGSYTKGIASTIFKNVNGRWFTSAKSTEKANHTYDFTYIKSGDVYGTAGTDGRVYACYSKDKTGLALQDQWANIKAEGCDNWWVGIDDSHLYNWTLNNAWHQYIKTGSTVAEEGEEPIVTYAGSDGKVYQKQGCDIVVEGTMENCLYGTKALVNGAFVTVEKNAAPDEGYHKSDAATTYYLCFDGCVWHPATRDAENLYTVDGTKYIWYNNAWLAVTYDSTVKLYYSLSATNVRIYYEYVNHAWVLASPVAEVVTSAGTVQVYSLEDAKTKAKAGGTNVTIRLLKDITISSPFTYDGTNNCGLDLNGYTLTGTVSSMITINNASATFIIKDQSAAGTGKILAQFSRSDNKVLGLDVTKGHLIINSGTVHIENTHASQGACGVVVKDGQKFTMNGGTLEVVSKGASWGVHTLSSTTSTVTINGGTIDASTTSASGDNTTAAIYGLGGDITVNGGTLNATASATYARGIYLNSANPKLTINGGTITATAPNTIYGLHLIAGATATVNSGTITATATGGTVRGILSYGTLTMNGGTVNANAGGSDSRGLFLRNNTSTIKAGASVNTTATTNAYGIYYDNGTPTVTVDGGTFTVSTSSTTYAYGVFAAKGTGTVNDGTFTVTAKTTGAEGLHVETTNTPKLTVNGGKFMVKNSNGSADGAINNTAAAAANFQLTGGYYHIAPAGSYVIAGKAVKDVDRAKEQAIYDAGYLKKIAGNEYTVTWKDFKGAKIIGTTQVESGKVPEWTGERPDYKDETAEREWIGWSTEKENGGNNYIDGTALPAVVKDVTYYAYCNTIFADVTAGGTTTRYNDIPTAWKAAMKQKQATIRILSNLGSEANPSNCRQLVFNPDNANSIITLDLNGHTWSMGDQYHQDVFLKVSPEQANCKLIVTDNSASGNGYLINKHNYAVNLICANVTKGELILQGGGLKCCNTMANSNAIGVQAAGGVFTMTGGIVESKKEGDAVTGGKASGVYCYSNANLSGGTIRATNTKTSAVGVFVFRNNVSTVLEEGLTVEANAKNDAYAVHGYGSVNIEGGTYNATATEKIARGIYMIQSGTNLGQATVSGNPTFTATAPTQALAAIASGASGKNVFVTIEGGTFSATATNGSEAVGVQAENYATATVKGGTFTATLTKADNGLTGSDKKNYDRCYGVYALAHGTMNVEGGTFNVQPALVGGNNDCARCNIYDDTKLNISGGTFTMTKGQYAVRCFGGETTITGNPTFTARYGIDIGSWAAATCTATMVVDGGTFNATVGEAVRCYTTPTVKDAGKDTEYTDVVTGDLTIWDGKFHSPSSIKPVIVSANTSTSNIKIRGGYYSSYTTSTLEYLTKYVVSPSKEDALASGTTEYTEGYRYRVNTKYNVTFSVNGEKTVKQYNRNETPSFGSTPAINDGNTYEFIGWTPEIAPVTTDVTYTAVFKKWEAEIIMPNGTSKRYESFATAWTDAQQIQNCTIRVLSDANSSERLTYNPAPPAGTTAEDEAYFTNATTTLDLNNHTLAFTGTVNDRFLVINKTGSKFIIDDSSPQKNGVIKYENTLDGELICVATHNGDLELRGGTILARNNHASKSSVGVYPCRATTFTMTGGNIKSYSRYNAKGVYTESGGTEVVNISGGAILASTEYDNAGTPAWGNFSYGIYAMAGAKITLDGNCTITSHANQDAYGLYAKGTSASAKGEITMKSGTVTAITNTKRVFGAYAEAHGIINIEGGIIDAHSTVAEVASMWNVEGAHCAGNGILNISGGDISSDNGASPIGVNAHGGTTTITGGKISSKVALFAVDYAAATQTATVIVNGGTFIATDYAVRVNGLVRDGTIKNNANVTINGGYFYSEGNTIAYLSNAEGANPSTLVLNGGKYCDKSGTTYKNQITKLKGATTTISDINEKVDDKNYKYELKTKFNVTWIGGSSYNKVEELWSGTMPSNAECTSFLRNDSAFYFTGWSPTPTYVTGDATYHAKGEYHVAKVKIGTGEWIIYDDFDEAWNDAMAATNTNVHVTLLNHVTLDDYLVYKPAIANARTTLDLNNFKLTNNNAVYTIYVNKQDAKLTITDTSTQKGGCIYKKKSSNTNIYGVYVYSGEVIMAGGKVYCENTVDDESWHPAMGICGSTSNSTITITGGMVETSALRSSYAVTGYGPVNISGGHMKATVTKYDNARALSQQVNTATITGGTFEAVATNPARLAYAVIAGSYVSATGVEQTSTVNISGGKFIAQANNNAYAAYVAGAVLKVGERVHAVHSTLNISGGDFIAKGSDKDATAIIAANCDGARLFDDATPHNMIGEARAELNITGGTFLAEVKDGSNLAGGENVEAVRCFGTVNISGGTFTLNTASGCGCRVFRGTLTISDNPVFNINTTTIARGIIVADWSQSAYCHKENNLAEAVINGGTFHVTATGGNVVGAYAARCVTANNEYGMSGKITINGGEFICTGSENVNAVYRPEDLTATYGTATATLIINGGKFKSRTGTPANPTYNGNNLNSVSKLNATGGYFVTESSLATHVADTCKVTTLATTDPEYTNGYRYKIEKNYVAKVSKAEASDRFFCVMPDAFDYAKTQDNSTITLLRTVDDYVGPTLYYTPSTAMSCTLDLNGFTFKGQATSGDPDRLLVINRVGCTFTIKDSSAGKTGKFSHEKSGVTNYSVIVYHGTVKLESGTVHCKNTSGDVQALRSTEPDAVIQVTGGKVHAEATGTAYAVNSYGPATISGGEILAEGEGTESAARGVNAQNTNADVLIKGAVTTINANAGKYAYGIYADGTSAKITVEAGTINSENANANGASITAYAISGGTIEINGGTFTATRSVSGTSNVQPIRTGNNATMIINDGTFNGSNYQAVNIRGGETTINGGTFNAAVGIRAMDWADATTITGTLTVTGGTFNTTAQTIYVSSKNNNSRNAHSEVTIKGGKFKTTGSTIVQMDAAPAGTTASTLTITGGYFNETSGSTFKNQIEKFVSSPYYCVRTTAADKAEVGDGYAYKVVADANIGFHADIVDVDNSAQTLTLNVSMWGASGWPYIINGVAYGKNSSSGQDKWREDDRTLILPYTGNAGDMFGIKVIAKNGTVVSNRLYTIPTAVTANTTLGDQQVVYVKRGATLTVAADKTVKNIYVAPGAKLVINSNQTLTADTVFLRTEAWESAEMEANGTLRGQICYTRIVKDESRYFQFGLPYDCPVSSVRLSSGHTIAYQGGWLLRSYSESSRADNGANGNNWQTLTDGTIRGCTGYEMFSAFGYYREFYFPVTPTDNTSVSVSRTGDNKAHSGWNIIVSPLMRAYRCAAVPEGPVASWLTEDGSYWQRPIEEIKPAIPFSYQAKEGGTFSFGATMVAPAPRRVAATDEPTRIQWIQLEIADAEGNGDQAGIYSHPTRYDGTYQTGIDVAKQSFEASRALLYTAHAYGDMAFAGVADSLLERGIPVTVYSPAGQELTFSLRENDWLDRLAEVWLIDNETGTRTDLLRDDYSFLSKAGTTAGRFVIMGRFYAPGVATGIHDVQSDDVQGTKARKVLVDDKMYILINGRTYDATGKLVTNNK